MKRRNDENGCIYYEEGGVLKRKHGMPSQKFISAEAGCFYHIFNPKCTSRNLCFVLTNLYIVYSTNRIHTYLHNDGRIRK